MLAVSLMSTTVVWHGTPAELAELARAVQHQCGCGAEWGMASVLCPPHAMLATDQQALDGLLRARRAAQWLREAEFRASTPGGGDRGGPQRSTGSAD